MSCGQANMCQFRNHVFRSKCCSCMMNYTQLILGHVDKDADLRIGVVCISVHFLFFLLRHVGLQQYLYHILNGKEKR
ncbi:hypothetical protein LguiB_007497 [Lonicera macranthoides]